jgi:hypothetical protein
MLKLPAAISLTSVSVLQSQLSPCGRCGLQLEGNMLKLSAAISMTSVSVLQSQLSPCGRCGLQVEGKMLKVSDEVFHPACFTCAVC